MDVTGALVAAAVIGVAVVVGLWHRRTSGRFRPAGRPARGPAVAVADPPADPPAAGQDGRLDAGAVADDADHVDAALLAALGVPGATVTLLQFSSAFCAPCRATRRVCADVAGMVPGVRHVEVDAESHLDAVRALGIWRTPTVLVLDDTGRVVRRATGVPAKAQVVAVLGEILAQR
jgi:thiol-disulfide isomerase/thioredoxin